MEIAVNTHAFSLSHTNTCFGWIYTFSDFGTIFSLSLCSFFFSFEMVKIKKAVKRALDREPEEKKNGFEVSTTKKVAVYLCVCVMIRILIRFDSNFVCVCVMILILIRFDSNFVCVCVMIRILIRFDSNFVCVCYDSNSYSIRF